jgi:hypothetical protein
MEPRETQANGRTASSNVPKVSPQIVSIPFVMICLFTSDVLSGPRYAMGIGFAEGGLSIKQIQILCS